MKIPDSLKSFVVLITIHPFHWIFGFANTHRKFDLSVGPISLTMDWRTPTDMGIK